MAYDVDLVLANQGMDCTTLEEAVLRLRRRLHNASLALRERQAEARRHRLKRVMRGGRSVLMEWQPVGDNPHGRLIPARRR